MNCYSRFATVLLWLSLLQHSLIANHSSKLCGKNDTSCQSQLENINTSEEDCRMKYFPSNTEECEEWTFVGSREEQLGKVKLEAYVYTENTYTGSAFNVSFLHIKWNHLRMRFKLNKHNNKKFKNSCREFYLPVEVSDSQKLYFDCPWASPTDRDYEDQYYGFEYEANGKGYSEHRQYLLEVPFYRLKANVTNIKDWPLFVYVDITNAPLLTVHWAAAPRWLGGVQYDVHGYNVTLHHNTSVDGSEESLLLGYVSVDQELKLSYNVGPTSGAYRFGVQINHSACGTTSCRLSFSPTINIKGNSRVFLIAVVGCSILIPMVLCALHVFKKWLERPSTVVKPHPIVLIVYVPTHKTHVRVVKELAAYLRSFCEVEALLHDLDMPRENMQVAGCQQGVTIKDSTQSS